MQNIKFNETSKKLQAGFFGFRIRQRRVSFLIMGIIVIAGIMSLVSIPKESSPEISFGIISITTIYQGSTPQDIDSLVTDKIEKEIKDIDGIKKISSTSSAGISNIIVEFDNDADMTQSLVDIKDAVDNVSLSSDVETPIVQDISTNNETMFAILLYGPKDQFSTFYLKEKGRKLKANLEGKGSINKIDFDASMDMNLGGISSNGDSFYNIEVLLNKQKVEELGLSIIQIGQTIKSRNSNQPLGNHTIGDLGYDFRIQGEIESITDLGELPIQTINGDIKLKDISTIQRILKKDNIQIMGGYEYSGNNYITLYFNKEKGDNIFSAAKDAKIAIQQEFGKTEYKGLSYIVTSDLSEIINEDYDALAKNGLQTLLLVFIALLIFVGLKESLIATITLPLAFLITFIVLKNLGLSLNFLTNFSFIITFGIAIDTTIVVIEGAHEKMKQGFNPKNSILLAVKEYKTPLISGTATTICVFIPLLTLPGIMGKFLAYIPITIFATLVAALFISLTLNSALYYKLSKPGKYFNSKIGDIDHMKTENKFLLDHDIVGKIEKPEHKKDKREKILDNLGDRYVDKLGNIMKSPKKRLMSILLSIGAVILSLVIISPNLGFELFPGSDNGYITINIKGPNGSTKEYMQTYNDEIEKIFSSQKEIKVYYNNIVGNNINSNIELIAKDKRKNLRNSLELETSLDKELNYLRSNGLKVSVESEKNGPPGSKPIGIKLITDNSNNLDILTNVSLDFENFLSTIAGAKNIESSSKKSPGQFVYQFDKIKMALMGLNPNNFNFEVFGVANGISAGTIKENYDDNDIKLFFEENKDNISPQNLSETNINTPIGKINFGNISDYTFSKAISSISRENNKIIISVSADTEAGIKADGIQTKLQDFAKTYEYPQGISYSMGGENQENMELIQAIMIAFAIALLCIFGILVLQFNSYTQPIIILFSVAVGLLGANIGLWVTNQPYSLMFGIGFIALTGIIVNDAIVLLDRANNNQKKGMTKLQAIKEAGKSRLQPIILTTLTTFLGLTSIVGDMMRKPLAITIMSGIIFGSTVTLFVIPNLYYDIDKLRQLFKRTIIKYILYLTLPIIITIGVFLILLILNIETTGLFSRLLLAIFIGFNIRYGFYTIHSRSNTGQTVVQKILGLKVLDKDHNIMTEKQAKRRYLITIVSLLGPGIIGMILSILIGFISSSIGSTVGIIVGVIGYLFVIHKNLILLWSPENKSFIDHLSNTITVDESSTK